MASTNMKNAGKKTTRKKRVSASVDKGQCHIQCSFNNTIVTFADANGNTLSWCSSGKLGLKGSKKSTPFAAQTCVENAGKEAVDRYGLKKVEVFVKGPGQGREQAIRGLATCGIDVISIQDVSPIAHNGCKPAQVRRV